MTFDVNRGRSHRESKSIRLASGFLKDFSNLGLGFGFFFSQNLKVFFSLHKHLTKVILDFLLADLFHQDFQKL
jgi:hypothetical protein